MLDRSNKAVHERDDSNYALKVTITENDKLKRRINAIESLMGKEKPEAIKSGSFKNPISVSMTTISTIMILGRRFSKRVIEK